MAYIINNLLGKTREQNNHPIYVNDVDTVDNNYHLAKNDLIAVQWISLVSDLE